MLRIMSSALQDALAQPLTLLTSLICMAWWAYSWNYDLDMNKVSISYKSMTNYPLSHE